MVDLEQVKEHGGKLVAAALGGGGELGPHLQRLPGKHAQVNIGIANVQCEQHRLPLLPIFASSLP